jgi:uncharacterized membrane protein
MLLAVTTCLGVVAGLRAMTAPAAIAWAAHLGWLYLDETVFSFMSSGWTVAVFTVLAAAELVSDQLPSTPSRKVPVQLGTRILMGALPGAAVGTVGASPVFGLIAGVVGAMAGTYGGAAARTRLASGFGRDLPAALVEDVVAVAAATLLLMVAS